MIPLVPGRARACRVTGPSCPGTPGRRFPAPSSPGLTAQRACDLADGLLPAGPIRAVVPVPCGRAREGGLRWAGVIARPGAALASPEAGTGLGRLRGAHGAAGAARTAAQSIPARERRCPEDQR